MKSVLVIGVGRFGKHIAMKFADLGNEVMVVDMMEESINEVVPHVHNAQIGDCTNEDVLESLGVGNFDICVVATGSNLGASLEITYQLKQLGAKYVLARVTREMHGKFLLNNGADEIIYPEKQIAERMAIKHSAKNAFDYMEVMPDYSISEVAVPEKWVGISVEQADIRGRHHINILVIKLDRQIFKVTPGHIFSKNEHLLVFGEKNDIIRFSSKPW